MMNVKAGSKVRIIHDGSCYTTYDNLLKSYNFSARWVYNSDPTIGNLYTVERVVANPQGGRDIAYCVDDLSGQGYLMGIDSRCLELVAEITKVPKKTGARLGSHPRQFDVAFKQSIVRAAKEVKRKKRHGGIKVLLETHGITDQHLAYWRKQHNEGHFSPERAVGFSRQTTMIHG
jgi:hypothetical protein